MGRARGDVHAAKPAGGRYFNSQWAGRRREAPNHGLRVSHTIEKHHIFFDSAWYSEGFEQQFRNYKGMLVPVEISTHKQVHRECNPMERPKPLIGQMGDCMDMLDGMEFTTHLGGLIAVQQYFHEDALTHPSPEFAERSSLIDQFLKRQLGVIAMRERRL